MAKRTPRPIFFHDGYLFRQQKTLTDGSELLYCDKRQTIGCTASAKRVNNHIFVKSGHTMHGPDSAVASAKLARYTVKKIAAETTCSPKELMKELGSLPLSGSRDSIAKMIYRARQGVGEAKPSTFDDAPKPMEYFDNNQSFDSFPNQMGTFLYGQETLQRLLEHEIVDPEPHVKQEIVEPEYLEENHDFTRFRNHEDETVILKRDTFFEDLRDVVRETVGERNQEIVGKISSDIRSLLSSETNRAPSGLEDCMKNFLLAVQSLPSDSISDDLKKRTEAVLNKIENKTIHTNLEQALEATLEILER